MLRELVNEETGWNTFIPRYTGDKGSEIIRDIDTLVSNVYMRCRVPVASKGIIYFSEETPFELDCALEQFISGRDSDSFGNMLLYKRRNFTREEIYSEESSPIQIYCIAIPGMINRPFTKPIPVHIGGVLKGAYATGKEEYPIVRIDQLLVEER